MYIKNHSRLHWTRKKAIVPHTLYRVLVLGLNYYYSYIFLSFHSLLYAEMQFFINCVRLLRQMCSIAQCKCRPMSYIGRSTAVQIPLKCVWNELTIHHYTHFNWIDALRTHTIFFLNKCHHKTVFFACLFNFCCLVTSISFKWLISCVCVFVCGWIYRFIAFWYAYMKLKMMEKKLGGR